MMSGQAEKLSSMDINIKMKLFDSNGKLIKEYPIGIGKGGMGKTKEGDKKDSSWQITTLSGWLPVLQRLMVVIPSLTELHSVVPDKLFLPRIPMWAIPPNSSGLRATVVMKLL